MRAGIEALLRDPSAAALLSGQKVGYLGPGTGLGSGYLRVDGRGAIARVLDDGVIGHVHVQAGGDAAPVQLPFSGLKGTIERPNGIGEIVSGTSISAIARELEQRLVAQGQPRPFSPLAEDGRLESVDGKLLNWILEHPDRAGAQAVKLAEEIADCAGEYLGRVVQRTHDGDLDSRRAEDPVDHWPPPARDFVAGTRHYVLGGSGGTKGVFSERLRAAAARYLETVMPDTQFHFLTVPGVSADAGARGARSLVPAEAVRRAIDDGSRRVDWK
jgi:hypothetical protein